MAKVGILGTGTWGTALGTLLSTNGHNVRMWSPVPGEIENLDKKRVHPNLPGTQIPRNIVFSSDMQSVISSAEVVVFAVPSVFMRPTAEQAVHFIENSQTVVTVVKGIESGTLFTMSEILEDVFIPERKRPAIVALSGPTHAEEVAVCLPTAIVAASGNPIAAEQVRNIFSTNYFKVYVNGDTRGCELCGALKNIIALACGISSGLGYGDNAKAAIMVRGLAEITALGTRMGCTEQTFAGLAGIGDLIVTATSEHSRNNRAGRLLGQGIAPADVLSKVGMVVEGINALPAAMQLMEKFGMELPIIRAVNAVVNRGAHPRDVIQSIMQDPRKLERS